MVEKQGFCTIDETEFDLDRSTQVPSPSNVLSKLVTPWGEKSPDSVLLPSPKPFFIMDFLEHVNQKDMERAQQILQSSKTDLDSKDTETNEISSKNPSSCNSFRLKSIAIGNGFNAQGIQEAKDGRWKEALQCWESALEVRMQVLGEWHPDVANTLNNMGIACSKVDRIDEAINYLERALEIRKVSGEPDQVAATMHNLGNVFSSAGDLETAISFFGECRMIYDELNNDIEVARAFVGIGHAYHSAGCYREAREAYEEALMFFRQVCKEDDSEILAIFEDMVSLEEINV
jgi:tetratricopeptide (TPR) repeat protein